MNDIGRMRLGAQWLVGSSASHPEEVVAWHGAVQAQEYGPARWALAQRLAHETDDATVAQAFDEGRLLRTHVLRPTWHFVARSDIRWMLALTGPRIRRAMASYDRQLGIDTALLRRSRRVFERTLARTSPCTRAELATALGEGGIEARGQRLAHIVLHAELDALVCSGPRRGKQFTYALVDQRAPEATSLSNDEALIELVRRFFRSHGPATLRDFTWWCGLPMRDGHRALEHLRAASAERDDLQYWWLDSDAISRAAVGPTLHLLPIYDEYTVAYRDRRAVPHGPEPGAGVVFQHAIVRDGRIVGTWRTTPNGDAMAVHLIPFGRGAGERRPLRAAVARYARFLQRPVTVSFEAR